VLVTNVSNEGEPQRVHGNTSLAAAASSLWSTPAQTHRMPWKSFRCRDQQPISARTGVSLYLDLSRLTRTHVRLNYADVDIRRVTVLDHFASSRSSRVEQERSDVPIKTVDIRFDGWVFPRSGVAFVWVLDDVQQVRSK
jgi:hypothetical protein